MSEGKPVVLKDMIVQMDSLMKEMQERMGKVMQTQKDNFNVAFKQVLAKIIKEMDILRSTLAEYSKESEEVDYVEQKLEFFRTECHLLNKLNEEVTLENKDLKSKLISLEQVPIKYFKLVQQSICFEQALLRQGHKQLIINEPTLMLRDRMSPRRKLKSITRTGKPNSLHIASPRSDVFKITDDLRTEMNPYNLERLVIQANDEVNKNPDQIRVIIKQLLTQQIQKVKEQLVAKYEAQIHQLKEYLLFMLKNREQARTAKQNQHSQHSNKYQDDKLRQLFIECVKIATHNDSLLPSIKKEITGAEKSQIMDLFLNDARLMRTIECKVFGLQCCNNLNCLYNLRYFNYPQDASTEIRSKSSSKQSIYLQSYPIKYI